MPRLDRQFFSRETLDVAIALLGTNLISVSPEGMTSGRVVEVEAYRDGTDLASHAAFLKKGGVRSMYRESGVAYIYRSYGIHAMFNVVAKLPGDVGAILIRALEPTAGLSLMRQRRSVNEDRQLARGPGNLCQALGITLDDHGCDLTTSARIWIESGAIPDLILAGPRVGITRSVEHPWRFFDGDSRFVSAHRRGLPLDEVDIYRWKEPVLTSC